MGCHLCALRLWIGSGPSLVLGYRALCCPWREGPPAATSEQRSQQTVSDPAPPTWPDTRPRTPQVRPRGQWEVGPTLHDASSNSPKIPVRGAARWLRHCVLGAIVGPHFPSSSWRGQGAVPTSRRFLGTWAGSPSCHCGEKHLALASSELCRLSLRALCEQTPGPEEDAQARGQVPAGSPPGSLPVPRPPVPCPVWDA